MTRLELTSRVGADGTLTLRVPFGPAEANREVKITVEPVPQGAPPRDQEEWKRFIEETAGSIPDPSFRRHEQGEFETRQEWA